MVGQLDRFLNCENFFSTDKTWYQYFTKAFIFLFSYQNLKEIDWETKQYAWVQKKFQKMLSHISIFFST